jgi:CspA family cold shock protein|tara:strand:- start:483 stop:935 length:453 start_codon:yes stop_codon:yes gene_type:complete
MFTKLLISLVMAALTSLALGYLAHQSLSIPTTNEAWGQFAILFLGILTAVLLVAQTQPSASHGSVEEDDDDDDDDYDDFSDEDFEEGAVKWFNTKKGYGFITRDQGDDIFVHFRNIKGQGRRSLTDGERVTYVVTEGDKGLQADHVSPIA